MKDLDLKKIIESMSSNEISEVIIKNGSNFCKIRKGGFKQNIITDNNQSIAKNITQDSDGIPYIIQAIQQPVLAIMPSDEGNKLFEVKSSIVGTYSNSPKDDENPFVEKGQTVKKGQTLCIIKAMNTLNEIKSDVNGIIREICLKDSSVVDYGKVLFIIELQ